jgi:hypothetical protein
VTTTAVRPKRRRETAINTWRILLPLLGGTMMSRLDRTRGVSAGATREEILTDYPYLEPEDIAAVLEFAARQNDHPVLRSA